MKWSSRFSLVAASTVALLAFAVSPQPAFSGKPKPPPPPPQPVKYEVQFWNSPGGGYPNIDSMNNNGQVVGWYTTTGGSQRAFLYDPGVNPTVAVDLNSIVAPPTGWVIASAVDINDQGMIVGYLQSTDGSQTVGYFLDTLAATPALLPLPTQGSTYSYGRRINESGDIAGVYRDASGTWGAYVYNVPSDTIIDLNVALQTAASVDINNPTPAHDTQICLQIQDGSAFGAPYRWTRGHGLERISGTNTRVVAINDSGTVSGSTYSGKPSRQYPFLYSTSLQVLTAVQGQASSINSSGDLLAAPNIYHGDQGFLQIGKLLDTADPDAAALLSATGGNVGGLCMNDRIPGPDFGQIVGVTQLPNGGWLPYFLTPVAP